MVTAAALATKFVKGAWVAKLADNDGPRPQIAKVRDCYEDSLQPGHLLLDLVMFDHTGEKVGRISPAFDGPKGFEPCCSGDYWVLVKEPPFEEMADSQIGWRHLLQRLD